MASRNQSTAIQAIALVYKENINFVSCGADIGNTPTITISSNNVFVPPKQFMVSITTKKGLHLFFYVETFLKPYSLGQYMYDHSM